MDRRFIIFVIFISSIFFIINYYTSRKNQEYRKIKNENVNEVVLKEKAKVSNEKRVGDIYKLPIVRIYESGKPVSVAVSTYKDSYMTLSSNENFYRSISVRDDKGLEIEANLIQADGNVALYAAGLDEPRISSANIPQVGSHDLYVVSINDLGNVEVVIAEFEDGQLFFPYQSPKSDAVVLYKYEDKYLTVGIYKSSDQVFMALVDFPKLNSFAIYEDVGEFSVQEREAQKFYVLENDTMQVVISNVGGAISEINLPFKSKENQRSVVLPIQFDNIIKKKYKNNALFPLNSYHIFDKKTKSSSIEAPVIGGYYPLLRRGIAKGSDYPDYLLEPKYYAFNIISEDPEIAQAVYNVTHFDDKTITLETKLHSKKIIRTYNLVEDGVDAPYCLNASIKVDGNSSGMWVSSGVPEVELISGKYEPTIKYKTSSGSKYLVEKLSLPKNSGSINVSSFQPDWMSNSNGYFSIIMDPLNEIGNGFQLLRVDGVLNPSKIVMVDSQNSTYPSNEYPGYDVYMPLKGISKSFNFRIYAGPLDSNILKMVDDAFYNRSTGYIPDYKETQSFRGWFSFITEPFGKFLFFIMQFFYKITHSWGFSIILLTIVLRLIMYPLNAWSIRSTIKLQEIGPKLQKLQERYKKDPKKSQMEIMSFYKEHKVNPFGGCLPLIIQMPLLFTMLDLLKSTFSLRGASFIPGWITNLSAPDVLFSWSYPLPFLGTEFHFLPVLLGVVMFLQQKVSSCKSIRGEVLTDQQKQQKKMGNVMTIVFTLIFYKFPSGLNIHWLSSMLLQILQQMYMYRKAEKNRKENSSEIVVKPARK